MSANYVLLERIQVGAAGASSVTFNNIPQTGYTDLKLVASCRDTRAVVSNTLTIAFNTGGTYSSKLLEGSGSAASSSNDTTGAVADINSASATANTFSNTEIYIPNYTSSNAKSFSADSVSETNGTTVYSSLIAGLWSGTGAITTIKLTPAVSASFVQYSTFSLYALAAVGTTPTKAPKAIGGDIIQTDGTYWYHAFLSSGSFTPQTALTCDVLVVGAGGAGGGGGIGGGGGAGGIAAYTSQILTANTSNLVTVGAGGAGTSAGVIAAGSPSQFAALTAATGGGGGAGRYAYGVTGGNGASGGGGGEDNYTDGSGGTGSNGHNGGSAANQAGGGGGGFGTAGSNGGSPSYYGGAGGNGVNTYSSWLSAVSLGVSGYIAAGGGGGAYGAGAGVGGGAGGSGGGGAGGGQASAGNNGTANTGSGGGGGGAGSGNPAGGNGGSGLVIVRYAY